MSEREQNTPSGRSGRVLRCDEWENLIADALDGTLSAADAAAFDRHHAECALCAQMLKETQQGKAWIEYLAEEPEVPGDLLKKILARTSGAVSGRKSVWCRVFLYRYARLPHARRGIACCPWCARWPARLSSPG